MVIIGVLLLVAAGLTAGLSSTSGGRPTAVTVSDEVQLGCTSGAVTIRVGQRLVVTGCPDGVDAVPQYVGFTAPGNLPLDFPSSARLPPPLEPLGASTFRGAHRGGETLALQRATTVSARVDPLAYIQITVIPAAASESAAAAATIRTVPCRAGDVRIPLGSLLAVAGCPLGGRGEVANTQVLEPTGSVLVMRGELPGTAAIRLDVPGASCTSGESCTEGTTPAGTIHVVVALAPGAREVDVATCTSAEIHVHVGDLLQLLRCPGGDSFEQSEGPVLDVLSDDSLVVAPGKEQIDFHPAACVTFSIMITSACSTGPGNPVVTVLAS